MMCYVVTSSIATLANVGGSIRAALNARTAAYKAGYMDEYKLASYAYRRVVKDTKEEV